MLPGLVFQGRSLPEGEALQLAIHFVRTLEIALRLYEQVRSTLTSTVGNGRGIFTYLRGVSELELTVIALHRSTRLAEGLVQSPETTVTKESLPSSVNRDLLRRMRNAIDHVDGPIRGDLQEGHMLAVFLTETDLMIDDEGGETLKVSQRDFGGWVSQLHALAAALTSTPDRWVRST